MSAYSSTLIAKRIGSNIIDFSLEIGGGLLGSYFGALVAALLTAVRNEDPNLMQDSIWKGVGFGFVFWCLSISFVNRVLIQGLSRASIGKKFFNLELVSASGDFTWQMMMKRWVLSEATLATGGIGYIVMFLNPESRAFHDMIVGTDVVPVFKTTYSMSMEYRENYNVFPFPSLPSRMIVLTSDSAERPMATVIRLPMREPITAVESLPVIAAAESSLAQVIEIKPAEETSSDTEIKKVA